MTESLTPTELKLIEAEDRLEITWSDGHFSDLTLRYLRGWCPCAECQGHFTSTYKFIERDNPKIVDIQPVGNYGMKPIWKGGHDVGIYNFELLRSLCTCKECDPEQVKVNQKERPR